MECEHPRRPIQPKNRPTLIYYQYYGACFISHVDLFHKKAAMIIING